MTSILQWLDGKKAVLLAIAGLVVGYLTTANILDSQLGALILSILNILAGGAAYATDRVLGQRNSLGGRQLVK